MNSSSKTDLDLLKQLSDDEIDYSDSPELTEGFFDRAELRIPARQAEYLVRVEPEIMAWFKSQGQEYQNLINAALREHITTH